MAEQKSKQTKGGKGAKGGKSGKDGKSGKGGKGGKGKSGGKKEKSQEGMSRKQARKAIHPKYVDCVITCGCGNVIETRSTKAQMTVAVCSKCHPFYSGTQRFLDTAGRVERFQRKYGWVEGKTPAVVAKSRKERLARAKVAAATRIGRARGAIKPEERPAPTAPLVKAAEAGEEVAPAPAPGAAAVPAPVAEPEPVPEPEAEVAPEPVPEPEVEAAPEADEGPAAVRQAHDGGVLSSSKDPAAEKKAARKVAKKKVAKKKAAKKKTAKKKATKKKAAKKKAAKKTKKKAAKKSAKKKSSSR